MSDNERRRGRRGVRACGRKRRERERPLHDNSFIRKDLDQEFSPYILIS